MPEQQFLIIAGRGDPNTSPQYAAAVEALHSVAYPVKFASRKQDARDFAVAAPEGLSWSDDYEAFTVGAKDAWCRTMMITQPGHITAPAAAEAS